MISSMRLRFWMSSFKKINSNAQKLAKYVQRFKNQFKSENLSLLLVNVLPLNRVSGKNITFQDDRLEKTKICIYQFFHFQTFFTQLFDQSVGDSQIC